MLRVAVEKKWLLEMPRIKKPKVRVFDKDFQYLKNSDEIQRLLKSAKTEGDFVHAAYAVSVYTGIRPGELAGLRTKDILMERRLMVIERSYEEATKNGEVRYVPILDPLIPILKTWLATAPGPLLFPNRAGNILDDRARLFNEIFHRVLKRANFPQGERNGKPSSYIRYYDLRHTFASHWVKNNGEIFKLSKILGHKSIQMTMRFAHMQPDAFLEDYDRLNDRASLSTPVTTQN
jgi:integrase